MTPDKKSYKIEALERGLEVLALFSREQPALTLSEIIEITKLNKSTAFRIVATLEETGYLERNQDTRRYRPGIKAVRLGLSAIAGLPLTTLARPAMESLVRQAEAAAGIAVLDSAHALYIERLQPPRGIGININVGSRLPASCTAIGRVLLSGLTAEEMEAWLRAHLPQPCRPRFSPSETDVRQDVIRVVDQGFAVNDGEHMPGLRAVAAPIRNGQGRIVPGMDLAGSLDHITQERLEQELLPLVRRQALHVSQLLGYDA